MFVVSLLSFRPDLITFNTCDLKFAVPRAEGVLGSGTPHMLAGVEVGRRRSAAVPEASALAWTTPTRAFAESAPIAHDPFELLELRLQTRVRVLTHWKDQLGRGTQMRRKTMASM